MHRLLVVSLLVVPAVACGNASAPLAPTVPGTAGTWSGNVTIAQQVGQMTWTLNQSGASIAGRAQMKDGNGAVVLNGSISGTLSGAKLTYSIAVAPGEIPAQPACAIRLDGNANLAPGTPSLLSGVYTASNGTCASGLSSGTFNLTSGGSARTTGPAPS